MDIQILGSGCVRCEQVESLVRETVAEAGVAAGIEKVTDVRTIAPYGVFGAPAVAVDGAVQSVGNIPKQEEILAWLGRGATSRTQGRAVPGQDKAFSGRRRAARSWWCSVPCSRTDIQSHPSCPGGGPCQGKRP